MNRLFLSACETAALVAGLKRARRANLQRPGAWIMSMTTRVFTAARSASRLLFVWMVLTSFSIYCSGDSLWQDGVSRPLVADKRGAAVGDIVTIIVQETTTTAKDNNTKTSKSSGVDASISSFLYPQTAGTGWLTKNGKMPAMKFDAKSDFNGGGAINNSEKIVARIAVRVIDVLPNHNLVLEGSRETAFSGEQQTAILRGTVRPEDIAANNTVFSYNIADASIKFVGKGAVSDTQRKGWFTKIWDKVTPF